MRSLHISTILPIWCLALLLLGFAVPARAETFEIDALARPQRIVYTDGVKITLSVTVRDRQGALVPDGFPVYFHTTLGTVPTVAYTSRGQVTLLMENHDGAGTAILTVTVGDSQRTLNIDFVGQSGAVTTGVPARVSYTLKASTVYYSVDKRLFDLRDNAKFTAPGFSLTAGAIQYDVSDGIVTAQGNITLTAEKRTLNCEKLYLRLGQQNGSLIQVLPSISFQNFSLLDLKATVGEVADPNIFQPLDPLPTNTWILCKDATVFPAEQIQFRRPQFYVNDFDRRLYSLPYHVLDLRSSDAGMLFNSRITLTSDAGLNVDFPVYYAANGSHIGSMHLRHVTKGSEFYRGTSGMQLSLEEEYLMGLDADGALYLDDLTRETRSATWLHSHDFGPTHVNLNAAYDRYNETTPYTTRFGLGVSREIGRTNVRLTSNWSSFQGNQDTYGELGAYLPSLMLGKTGTSLNFSPFLGFRQSVDAATDTQAKTTTSNFYQGVSTGVGLPSIKFLGGSISTNLGHELTHEQDGLITQYFDAGAGYHRQLGGYFSGSLNYSYSLSKTSRDTQTAAPSQRVGMDIYGGRAQVWSLSGYSSYDLDAKTLFSSGSLTYYLPWQRRNSIPRWYVRANASMSSGNSSASDQLFSLGRSIGAYTLVFHYSPTGNMATTGIGSGTGKKWSLELQRSAW
jgi:hypothetical protein